MLYTMRSVSNLWRCEQGMKTAWASRAYFWGTFLRTAFLLVFLAVRATAAPPQDPVKPVADAPPSPPLSVLCASATTIQLGVAYNSTVTASGGTGVYRFA